MKTLKGPNKSKSTTHYLKQPHTRIQHIIFIYIFCYCGTIFTEEEKRPYCGIQYHVLFVTEINRKYFYQRYFFLAFCVYDFRSCSLNDRWMLTVSQNNRETSFLSSCHADLLYQPKSWKTFYDRFPTSKLEILIIIRIYKYFYKLYCITY